MVAAHCDGDHDGPDAGRGRDHPVLTVPQLLVQVTPRAAVDRVGPLVNGVLHVRVTRPPSEGEANRAVLRLVARALGLSPSSLRMVAGEQSRHKRFAVDGISSDELVRRLTAID